MQVAIFRPDGDVADFPIVRVAVEHHQAARRVLVIGRGRPLRSNEGLDGLPGGFSAGPPESDWRVPLTFSEGHYRRGH